MENSNEAMNKLLIDMVQNQKESNRNLTKSFMSTTICLTIIIAIMIVAFFVYEGQFDVVDTGYSYEYDQEAEAGDNGTAIVNGNGDIRYADKSEE